MLKKNIKNKLRQFVYLVLPVVLLYLIFRRIDFVQIQESVRNANLYYIIAGICIRPLLVIFGSIRWYALCRFYLRPSLTLSYLNRQYWEGLAIGFFTPGGTGWDAYRIIVTGKKSKAYTSAFITVIAEKFTGLLSVLIMIIILFPFVSQYMTTYQSEFIIFYKYSLFGLLFVLLSTIAIYKKKDTIFVYPIYQKIKSLLLNIIQNKKIIEKVRQDYRNSPELLSFSRKPCLFSAVLILSFAILVISAVSSQIIFMGLTYDISFLINLFAAPVFFILFMIPISFGSIGVREGAYILFYGLFGVPMETSLLVSFFNLLGILLNNGIGAFFLLTSAVKENVKAMNNL